MMTLVKFKYIAGSVEGDDDSLSKLSSILRAAGMSSRSNQTNSGSFFEVFIPEGAEARLKRGAGRKRRSLPEDSPLVGLSEKEAYFWCIEHGAKEAAIALGISVPAAYQRLRSGKVL